MWQIILPPEGINCHRGGSMLYKAINGSFSDKLAELQFQNQHYDAESCQCAEEWCYPLEVLVV